MDEKPLQVLNDLGKTGKADIALGLIQKTVCHRENQ
jgi:hypothetical protein